MKIAILAGGVGSRLAQETKEKPKAMVEIGGRPVLWHIMIYYAHHGFKRFVIALGYKGEVIRDYVMNNSPAVSNGSRNLPGQEATVPGVCEADWTVELVNTGLRTASGGRLKLLAPYLDNETFMLTYCDGLSDVNLHDLLAFHRTHGKLATLTAVHPPSPFGHLKLNGDQVVQFREKPPIRDLWINGGFFVLEPEVMDYIQGDETQWERAPLERLAREGQLMAYRHDSFWQCMDTLHQKQLLEELWQSGNAPWKTGA